MKKGRLTASTPLKRSGLSSLKSTQKPLKSSKKPLKSLSGVKLRQKSLKGSLAKTTLSSKSKLPTISKLKKEADKWWSLATRLRHAKLVDGEWLAECVTDNNGPKPIKVLQCGHFQSRRFNSVRYNEQNTAPQCYGCNVMQQGKQFEFGLWIDKFYGEGTAMGLYLQAQELHQFTRDELEKIIADAKEEIHSYGYEIKK